MDIVTGGAGFIGSNLCDALLSKGGEVVCIDNMHTGSPENVAHLKDHKNFSLKIGNSGSIGELNVQKPETIFHLGIYSSSPMYKSNPILTAKAIEEFIKLLEFARKNDSRVVFASTSSLYNGLIPPHREDMVLKVTDYYSEARISIERISDLYSSLYGMKISGMRFFSVYGPREKSKGKFANLVSQFLWDVAADRKVVVYGDGNQTRDFIYVSDIVTGLILASKSQPGIYNLGTGKNYSINEAIALIGKAMDKTPQVEYIENSIRNYVAHTLADVTKAERVLGFKATVSLEQGVKNLVEFYGYKR